jgi:hypothetical protein
MAFGFGKDDRSPVWDLETYGALAGGVLATYNSNKKGFGKALASGNSGFYEDIRKAAKTIPQFNLGVIEYTR